MQRLEITVALVACLVTVYLTGSWRARSDEAGEILRLLEETVRAIAGNASRIYDNSCDLVTTCHSTQNCSRRECYPLLEQQSECVFIQNFSLCAQSTRSQCNRVKADFHRSRVRLPGNETLDITNSDPSSVDESLVTLFGTTICAQKELDSVFRAQRISILNEQFYYSIYFGSADGVFRFYPARRSKLPRIYSDHRNFSVTGATLLMPEYVHGAISVKKEVVILLDTSYSMVADNTLLTRTTSLDIARNLTRSLVRTLTRKDKFTVIALNETDAFSHETQVVNDSNIESGTYVDNLLNDPTFAGTRSRSARPSNFKAGFDKANATLFNRSTVLKIIVLFTDSTKDNSPTPEDQMTTTALKQQGTSVFVYDLTATLSVAWDGMACYWNSPKTGPYIKTAKENPLLFLNSYLSFLTRARIQANNGSTVFWSYPYRDAGDLETVITVSYPAISSDNSTLVGVAGLDIQMSGLSGHLQDALENSLRLTTYKIPQISSFTDPISCSRGYENSCPSNKNGSFFPICNERGAASNQELLALLCCDGKGCISGDHHGGPSWRILWITLGVLGGLRLAALFSIPFLMRGLQRRREGREGHTSLEHSNLRLFPYETLFGATNGFDQINILGWGGFGVVYRGHLQDEQVAIKHLNRPADRAKDFQAEFQVLNVTDHPNLVRLIGTCFRRQDCFLVYELIRGGDLSKWLWPELGTSRVLTWGNRIQIAMGVAEGLDYLHRGLSLSHNRIVYHLDIKPQNILLERNFNAKIADFGNSQIYGPRHTVRLLSDHGEVRGTLGYMAPEVLNGAPFNSKLDVFSYGIVLLQLVSGRKIDAPEAKPYLRQWARNLLQQRRVDEIIDRSLRESVHLADVEKLTSNCDTLIRLALDCTDQNPEFRPEMIFVLGKMERLLDVRNFEPPFFDVSEDDSL